MREASIETESSACNSYGAAIARPHLLFLLLTVSLLGTSCKSRGDEVVGRTSNDAEYDVEQTSREESVEYVSQTECAAVLHVSVDGFRVSNTITSNSFEIRVDAVGQMTQEKREELTSSLELALSREINSCSGGVLDTRVGKSQCYLLLDVLPDSPRWMFEMAIRVGSALDFGRILHVYSDVQPAGSLQWPGVTALETECPEYDRSLASGSYRPGVIFIVVDADEMYSLSVGFVDEKCPYFRNKQRSVGIECANSERGAGWGIGEEGANYCVSIYKDVMIVNQKGSYKMNGAEISELLSQHSDELAATDHIVFIYENDEMGTGEIGNLKNTCLKIIDEYGRNKTVYSFFAVGDVKNGEVDMRIQKWDDIEMMPAATMPEIFPVIIAKNSK